MYLQHKRAVLEVIQQGPFAANWESLQGYQIPQWYQDAKFGIFIHWGVYSVPAFANEWYPRNMYIEGSREYHHHRETYGPHTEFGYKDFIPLFRAEKFDPNEWAGIFRRAGAQFVVPVAEHHDGFAMYDCSYSEWNAVKMGPKRDIIGELADAVRRQGLVFGVSSHRAEHWWFFNGGMKFPSDVQDARFAGLYGPAQPETLPPNEEFLDDWLLRTCELVDKYQPQIVWFDWWIEQPVFQPYLQMFAAYYYNRAAQWQRGVVINYKNQAFPEGTAVYDIERGQFADIHPRFWQTDTSVAKNSWGYVQGQDYKSAESLIGDLVDIVSKNGALLLNIGPRPDGTIPEPEMQILTKIGDWLAVYGEAIYGTRPWKVYGEGPTKVVGGSFNDTKRATFTSEDIRFTTRGEILYAIALGWPSNGQLVIRSLADGIALYPGEIGRVEWVGSHASVTWRREKQGLVIDLPEQRPAGNAFALRIIPAAEQRR
ncbi:alpha-L-fucosidase [Alicyclobacillus cellulosilyticus]|uniref:alpha-L-fucosidase n=1 Tax=Alicyclobacillus cellulosilyticus TaxID=1003997 RepID=A0A917K8K4_9BACL|nr:alpha-L-fucosidase [Alicyclobacillus cellulosilyticus]GGJ02196.1 alpha-L-fucosidase [Alicyclobacillus cellulosilyticus]